MVSVLLAESLDEPLLAEMAAAAGCILHPGLRMDGKPAEEGVHLYYAPGIAPEALESELRYYDALAVRPKPVSADAIRNAPNLRLVVRGGAGVNSIALDMAEEQGVAVANTPGLNSTATAECTLALMHRLAGRRHIGEANRAVWEGKPESPETYAGYELEGKHLALAGFGHIGTRVARMARGYGMTVSAWSPNLTPERAAPYETRPMDTLQALLAAQPDIVSLHIPLTADTRHVLSQEAFALLKPGTVLINTARPQLVDPAALAAALDQGIIATYGIDGDPDQLAPFLAADPAGRGILLPHIGDATHESLAKITAQVVRQLLAFFQDGTVINRVV